MQYLHPFEGTSYEGTSYEGKGYLLRNSYYIHTPSQFKSRAPVLSSRVVVKRQGFQIDLTLAIQQVCSIMHPCNKQATLFSRLSSVDPHKESHPPEICSTGPLLLTRLASNGHKCDEVFACLFQHYWCEEYFEDACSHPYHLASLAFSDCV